MIYRSLIKRWSKPWFGRSSTCRDPQQGSWKDAPRSSSSYEISNSWHLKLRNVDQRVTGEFFVPVVSIGVDLEGGFSMATVVAEEFLQGDDTSDGQGYFTGD